MSRIHVRGAAIGVLVVALLLGLGSLLVACGSAGSAASAGASYPVTTLDGKNVKLSDYKGRPLFLAFMSST
jgi:hypothetical protein